MGGVGFEEGSILCCEVVMGFSEDVKEVVFGERVESVDVVEVVDEFGNEVECLKVFRGDEIYWSEGGCGEGVVMWEMGVGFGGKVVLVVGYCCLCFDFIVEVYGWFGNLVNDGFVEIDEGVIEDEEDVGCVDGVLFDFFVGRGGLGC